MNINKKLTVHSDVRYLQPETISKSIDLIRSEVRREVFGLSVKVSDLVKTEQKAAADRLAFVMDESKKKESKAAKLTWAYRFFVASILCSLVALQVI